MNQLLENSFDFSIRAMELIRYLNEEKKTFLLRERFLVCATGIGISLRLTKVKNDKSFEEALDYAVETEYLLEIMVKIGCLKKKQSQPIVDDCRALKYAISELVQKEK